ncbi:MAG: hypothetical protein AB7V42_04130 [Thermoleophilia bacterium]
MHRRTGIPLLALFLAAMLCAVPLASAKVLRSPGLKGGQAKAVATKPPTAPAPSQLAGNGTEPDVVVDEAGTSHIVWNEPHDDGTPDVTVYCRVPRGSTACDAVSRLVPPGADQYADDSEGPQVVAVNDSVVVLSHRYPQQVRKPVEDTSEDDNTLYMWTSDDGGSTFTGPGIVGNANIGGDVGVFGPADAPVLGVITGVVTGGTTFTAIRGGRYTPSGAKVADGDFVDGRVAVLNGQPVISYQGIDLQSFVRRWSGQGDVSDPGTWNAPEPVPGRDIRIAAAGGKLYAATVEGVNRSLVLRDLTGGGAPVTLAREGTSSVLSLIGEPDGGAVAVWRGALQGLPEGIWRATVDSDGRLVSQPNLVSATGGLWLAADATFDGGGVAVVDGGDGRILLSAFGNSGPTGQVGLGGKAGPPLPPDVAVSCNQVKIGAAAVRIPDTDTCFLPGKTGGARVSEGPIRLNGLDIIPSAGVQIQVDPRAKTLRSTGTVSVVLRAPGIPDITLFTGVLNVSLSGKRVGSDLLPDISESLAKPKLLGFPIRGGIVPKIAANGAVTIAIDLEFPVGLGSVRGNAVIRANNERGLVVDSLLIKADNIPLGPATLRRLQVEYKAQGGTSVGDCLRPPGSGASAAPDEWAGVFELQLPPPQNGPGLCGSIRFGAGQFRAATFRLDLPPPGIPVFPGVAITSLSGGLSLDPREVTAGVRVVALGTGGSGAVTLDGSLTARLTTPVVLRGGAVVSVAGFRVGNGDFTISTDGYVRLRVQTGFDLDVLRANVAIEGFVDAPRREFSVSGKGDVCAVEVCVSGEVVVSTKGLAVCGPEISLPPPLPDPPAGGGLRWGETLPELWFGECQMSDYTVTDTRTQAREQQLTEGGYTVVGSPRFATIKVTGTSRVPDVDLVAPDGTVVTPANAYPQEAARALYLLVPNPAAGRWTVRMRAGSDTIAEVAGSHSVTGATARGVRVTGKGRAPRTLRYSATIGPDQGIVLVERGPAGTRVIGRARKGSHTLRFTPAPGPGGRREIVALAEQGDWVRSETVVGSYVAPPPARPGRAAGLRIRRAGRNLSVTWKPGANAARQRVVATLPGGRLESMLLGARARRVTIRNVARSTRATVTVTTIATDGRASRAARASIKAARG